MKIKQECMGGNSKQPRMARYTVENDKFIVPKMTFHISQYPSGTENWQYRMSYELLNGDMSSGVGGILLGTQDFDKAKKLALKKLQISMDEIIKVLTSYSEFFKECYEEY